MALAASAALPVVPGSFKAACKPWCLDFGVQGFSRLKVSGIRLKDFKSHTVLRISKVRV